MKNFFAITAILLTLVFSCHVEEKINPDIKNDDIIKEPNSPPDSFEIHVRRVMYDYADIIWENTGDPEGDSIYYSVYLNQIKQTDDIFGLSSYKFENLVPETFYQGGICAKDSKGDSIVITFSFETTKYFLSFNKLITIQGNPPGPHSLAKCNDGGYIIGGTNNFGNSSDLIAIKTDSLGDVEWYKIHKYDLDSEVVQIKQTTDGGYIMVSRKKVLRLDNFGDFSWEYLKTENLDHFSEGFKSIIESDHNDFYVTGSVYFSSTNTKLASITKFSKEGELLWEKYYGNNKWNEGSFIERSGNDKFVILGNTGNESEDLFFLEIDQNGDILIEKIFEDPDYDFARQIKPTSDGGYIVAGYSWGIRNISSVRIIKLDNQGKIIWDNKFRWGSFQDVVYGITQVTDGDYVFTGVSGHSSSSSKECLLAKIDNSGNLLWHRLLKPDYMDYSWAGIDIQSTNDNGIVLIGAKGWVWNQSDEKEFGLWILRTNEFGEYYE
jgi:hypothetical protein